uniref:Uncharacterized protein n=1 Tax=Plectus sambesii TaxID=2011161 RepID=A0A914XIS5_9BILA
MSMEPSEIPAAGKGTSRPKRRSSILKPQQPSSQNYPGDADTTTTKMIGRRVSFSTTRLVKQFDTAKNISMSPKNEPIHHDSSAEASRQSEQSRNMTLTQVNFGMTSVYGGETTFNSMAMEMTEIVQPAESFFFDEENYESAQSRRAPFTSTPRQRIRGVSAFGLEAEANEDDDMQISDDQSINVRRLIERQSLGMDLTLGNASASHTRKFLGNLIGQSYDQQFVEASNLTSEVMSDMQLEEEENGEQSMTLSQTAALATGQKQESGSIMELTEVDYNNATQNVAAAVEEGGDCQPAGAIEEDSRRNESHTPLLSSTRHHQSGTMMELTVAAEEAENQNRTRNVLAASEEDSRRNESHTPMLSSTRHHQSGTMMELTVAAEEAENHNRTRNVLAEIGGARRDELSREVDLSLSTDMTFTEPSFMSHAAPTPAPAAVVNERNSTVSRDVTSSSMNASARLSTSRIPHKENSCLSTKDTSRLSKSKSRAPLNETFSKCPPSDASPVAIAKKKSRQFSPLNKSQMMSETFMSQQNKSRTEKAQNLTAASQLSPTEFQSNDRNTNTDSVASRNASVVQVPIEESLLIDVSANCVPSDDQQQQLSNNYSTNIAVTNVEIILSPDEQAQPDESELERTVAKMRRSMRRSIDDSIRASAMSPRRRRSRTLNQSSNWSALNASNVTNLLDDVSIQLKESTLEETNTEHKRVFASVAIRSLLEPSFTVDLAEPKSFAEVEETFVEETVSVPFCGIEVNPDLKQLDLYQAKAADCDVVASSKEKLLENAKLKLQNANQQLRESVESRLNELASSDAKLAEAIRKINPAKLNAESQRQFEVCRLQAQSDWCFYRSKLAESLKASLQMEFNRRLSESAKKAESRAVIDQLAALQQNANAVNARLALQQKVDVGRVDEIVNRKHNEERVKAEIHRLQTECDELDMHKSKATISLLESQITALEANRIANQRRRQQRDEQARLAHQRMQLAFQQIQLR